MEDENNKEGPTRLPQTPAQGPEERKPELNHKELTFLHYVKASQD